MMGKIFNKLDKLDMVYVLRLCAFILFFAGLFSLVMSLTPYFKPNNFDVKFLFGVFSMVLGNVFRFIFEIAVLLGLAELIKIRRRKEND